MLRAHGVTHCGHVRAQNEDAFLVAGEVGLYLIADGMGGENAGEIAARVALDSIQAFILRSATSSDHTWPFGIDSRIGYQANRLRTAIKLANRTVLKESEGRAQYTGMGTTVVAILADAASAAICSVGDSRAYSIVNGGITRLTRDHTWLEALLAQNPDIDPASLARHPMRHVLTSVVGVQPDLEATVLERPLADGERLLLCTDGVHRSLGDDRLHELVGSAPDAATAAERVLSAALEADGTDNATALVVEYART